MRRLQNFLPAILLIVTLLVFTLLVPAIVLLSGEKMDTNSIIQAGQDIRLVMILTWIIIILLVVIGMLIYRLSLHQELQHTKYNQRDDLKQTWQNNYWQGISTELVGAAITAFLFGVVMLLFQQYQSIQNDKMELILQMGSPDNAIATEAVRVARQKGWHIDGTLHEAELLFASLQYADLSHINLAGAYLGGSNLSHTAIFDAYLSRIDLQGANLSQSILMNVDLIGANLSGANLSESTLLGTDLWGADLTEANLDKIILDLTALPPNNEEAMTPHQRYYWSRKTGDLIIGTRLPDGSNWTPDTDMLRFTDFDHPEFESTRKKINDIRFELGLNPIPNYAHEMPPWDGSKMTISGQR